MLDKAAGIAGRSAAAFMTQSLEPGASVKDVAQRHGIAPQQLTTLSLPPEAGLAGTVLPGRRIRDEQANETIFRNRNTMVIAKAFEPWAGRLDPEAYHDARTAAPGWDVHLLEQEWRNRLGDNEIEPKASMSGKGNCLDNAPMESFFGSLKTEMVHRAHFRSRREAKAALFEYIAIFYNREHRHSRIGYRTPVQARIDTTRAEAA